MAVVEVVAEVTTTDAREAAEMVDATVMENGTKPAEHIREMIVATAVARTAADRAAIAGAVVATVTSRSRRTTAGRSLQGTLMETTVGVAETGTETTVVEEVVVMTETAMEVVEADVAARRTGRNRLRGTRESKLSSLAPARWPAVESTLTGTRIFRLKRLATTCLPASNPLPRWSSRP